MTAAAIRALVAEELGRPAGPEAAAFAEVLAARPGVAAILFYGARRRSPEERGGPLDLYVLTDGDGVYHGRGLAALANRLLPPNVYREKLGGAEAKVAVMRLDAFRARMRPTAWDTTLWARFSQPATLVWARDAATRAAVVEAVAAAAATAGFWAARLSPPEAGPEAAWTALFRATYRAELRVEGKERAAALVAAAPARWRRLHALAAAPHRDAPPARAPRWRPRSMAGKALNLLRLMKAAATYRGGAAYLAAKLLRHSPEAARLSARLRRLR